MYGVPVATAAGLAMVPLAAVSAWRAARALGVPESVASAIVPSLAERVESITAP